MATTTGALMKVRNSVLALGVGASLTIASLGLAASAEARVPEGDRVSTTAIDCGWVQDQYDAATKDFLDAKLAGDAQKMRAAQNEQYKFAHLWYSTDCDDHYGGLSRMLPATPTKIVGQGGTVVGVSPQTNPTTTSATGQTVQKVGGVLPSFSQID